MTIVRRENVFSFKFKALREGQLFPPLAGVVPTKEGPGVDNEQWTMAIVKRFQF
jgi:hypothetical protein